MSGIIEYPVRRPHRTIYFDRKSKIIRVVDPLLLESVRDVQGLKMKGCPVVQDDAVIRQIGD